MFSCVLTATISTVKHVKCWIFSYFLIFLSLLHELKYFQLWKNSDNLSFISTDFDALQFMIWLSSSRLSYKNFIEYSRVVGVVRPPLGTTVPHVTLESQMSTNVVMPHPDDALLHHDDYFINGSHCTHQRHIACRYQRHQPTHILQGTGREQQMDRCRRRQQDMVCTMRPLGRKKNHPGPISI